MPTLPSKPHTPPQHTRQVKTSSTVSVSVKVVVHFNDCRRRDDVRWPAQPAVVAKTDGALLSQRADAVNDVQLCRDERGDRVKRNTAEIS